MAGHQQSQDVPEGQRGWIINTYDRAARRFDLWWNAKPNDKWRKVLIAILALFFIRAIASFFSEYGFQKVGLSTVRDLRNQLYERIINQSHRFFADRSTGEMVSRLVSDADQIQAAVSTRMGDLFQESVTLVGLLIPFAVIALMAAGLVADSRRRVQMQVQLRFQDDNEGLHSAPAAHHVFRPRSL